MSRKEKFGKWYLKYIVKSPVLFCVYLGVFFVAFRGLAGNLRIEVRQTFEAEINENSLVIRSEVPIEIQDNKAYIYTDKNQEVELFYVEGMEYREGMQILLLHDSPGGIAGKVTVEVVSDKKTLLQKIFN